MPGPLRDVTHRPLEALAGFGERHHPQRKTLLSNGLRDLIQGLAVGGDQAGRETARAAGVSRCRFSAAVLLDRRGELRRGAVTNRRPARRHRQDGAAPCASSSGRSATPFPVLRHVATKVGRHPRHAPRRGGERPATRRQGRACGRALPKKSGRTPPWSPRPPALRRRVWRRRGGRPRCHLGRCA